MSSDQDQSTSPPQWPIVPDFGDDAFKGTARYYADFRERYPQAMLDEVAERGGVTGNGLLLDLGCGTGQVALPMSSRFRQVLAVDAEPEMVEVGREEAARLQIDNVDWIVSRAEDLDFPDRHFEMITTGNAFHRLDRRQVGRRAMVWLPPGRCFVVLGSGSDKHAPWRKVVKDVVRRWTTRPVDSSEPQLSEQPTASHGEVLSELGFEVDQFERPTRHDWTVDELVGRMWSSSVTSLPALGDRAAGFEEDLRRSLLAHDPSGTYGEEVQYFFILAKVPTT